MSTSYTLSGNVRDLLDGSRGRSAQLFLSTNLGEAALAEKTSNKVLFSGPTRIPLGQDGTFSVEVIGTDSTDLNVAANTLRWVVSALYKDSRGQERSWSSGAFALTADKDLSDVVADAVPPAFLAGTPAMTVIVVTGNEPRPDTPAPVFWIGGTVQPVNMLPGDVWLSAGSAPSGGAPNITTTVLNSLVVGVAFSQTLGRTGTAPITWAVTAGALPTGLTLNASTGVIAGTPSASGAYSFTVTATNADGSDSQPYTGTVAASATPPTITTTTLAAMTQGAAYSQALAATGTTPMTWGISAGTLPAGLGINSSTGAISGTPTGTGAYSFTVQATNSAGSDTQAYSGTVAAAPAAGPMSIFGTNIPGATTVHNDGGGALYTADAFYATKSIRVLGLRIFNSSAADGTFLSTAVTAYAYARDWTGSALTAPTWGSPTQSKAYSSTRTAGTWTDILFDTPITLNAVSSGSNSPDCVVLAVRYAGGNYYQIAAGLGSAAVPSGDDPAVVLAEANFPRRYNSIVGGDSGGTTSYALDLIFEVV